jgi:hypothetical protein
MLSGFFVPETLYKKRKPSVFTGVGLDNNPESVYFIW